MNFSYLRESTKSLVDQIPFDTKDSKVKIKEDEENVVVFVPRVTVKINFSTSRRESLFTEDTHESSNHLKTEYF